MNQFPFSFWKSSGTPPDAPASFDNFQFLLSDTTDGYDQANEIQLQYRVYAKKSGLLSTGYVDSGLYGWSEGNNQVDIFEAPFFESGPFDGDNNWEYDYQISLDDGVTTGYSQVVTQPVDIYTSYDSYGASEISGSAFSPGDSVDYKVWGNWSGGFEWLSENSLDFNVVTTQTCDLDITLSGVSGIEANPRLYIERNVNGGGWEYKFWTGASGFSDDGTGWSAGTIPGSFAGAVPYYIKIYLFGSGFTPLEYTVQRTDMNSSAVVYDYNRGDTLGYGFVDENSGWTSGSATFQTANKFKTYIEWSASPTSGATYRILSYYRNFNVGGVIRNYDYYQETGSLDLTDTNTGWTAV